MLILDPIDWDGDDIDLACGTINGIAQTSFLFVWNGKIPFESTNFNTKTIHCSEIQTQDSHPIT